MSFLQEISKAIRVTIIIWVLTALIYPGFMLFIGLLFPYQAHGSLIENKQGQVVGSALIGQPFSSEHYFWSRPSAVDYSTADPKKDTNGILKTGVSGASNLAPSNSKELLKNARKPDEPDLLKRIRSDVSNLQKAEIRPTSDLVYSSGSGLDPHITVEAAHAQVKRIAKARSLSPDDVQHLINENTDGRFLGIFGEPGVNTLTLNLALDQKQNNALSQNHLDLQKY